MSEENKLIKDIRIDTILESLPHRYPFLLVDRVTEIDPGKYIKAYKNLTYNEEFFQGHFPSKAMMPGVLMLEALAQASIIFMQNSMPEKTKDQLFVLTGIDNARFRKPVIPGDRFEIVCDNPKNKFAVWKIDGKGYVDGQLVVEATLTAAATKKED